MNLKNKLKRSVLFHLLIYLRYKINRYLLNFNFRKYKIAKEIKIDPVDEGICFFGYYNISPSNINGDVLYLKVNKEFVRGSLFETAMIMLKRKAGSKHILYKTKAWNWQQGCMLQWHPKQTDWIIFNDYDESKDHYITKVINTEGEILRSYDMPVNNVSKCGKFALSLNYDRLAAMRPDYGYFNKQKNDLPDDSNDGIWYIDLESSAIKLIITIERLKQSSYSHTMEGAIHKVNHIEINPSGKRFMFLHRWIGPWGRFMRLITANPDGTNLYILNGDLMTSHCSWLNDKDILSFCENDGKRGYFKFVDKSNKAELLSDKLPNVDGHPSISPCGHYIITDTYPDKSRFSSLFLYNIENDEIKIIGIFHQPFNYKKEMRIDLHPKWSADGRFVFFESGHEGTRTLFTLQFEKLL